MHTITLLVDLPPATDANTPVYIAGDFQQWNPRDPACRLEPTDVARRRRIDLLLSSSVTSIACKFTLGSWASVEKDAAGREIPNRLLRIEPGAIHRLRVAAWAEPLSRMGEPAADNTLSGDIRRIDLPAPPSSPGATPVGTDTLSSVRPAWIYLPPGYDSQSERRYAVLYLLDGQNVFDQATSFAGEWHADETCEAMLSAAAIEPLIVVGVANGGARRGIEYTPWPSASPSAGIAGGSASLHLQWLATTVIPYIDTHYRTRARGADRALAGSSFGGLFTLYAALERPDLFGRAGVFSPSVGWNPVRLFSFLEERARRFETASGSGDSPLTPLRPRIYLDMGGMEPGYFRDQNHNQVADCIDDLRSIAALLEERGGWRRGEELFVVEDATAHHAESYWAQRFPGFLRRLFPPLAATE
jgi:hypothetical protein